MWEHGWVNRRRYIALRNVKTSVMRRYGHRRGLLTVMRSLIDRCIGWEADRTVFIVRDKLLVVNVE